MELRSFSACLASTTTVVVLADRYRKNATSAARNKPKTAAKLSQTGSRNGRRWRLIRAGASISVSYKNKDREFLMLRETFGAHNGLCGL
jgi:hypothetical protein